jgi:hypothetical protein
MQPFDLAVPPDRIGDSVQTVADAAVVRLTLAARVSTS